MTAAAQQRLSEEQIAEFYHDEFVQDQARDFRELVPLSKSDGVVVDIGGGVGFFAERLQAELGHAVRVIDMDSESVARCQARSVPAQVGDALAPPVAGDEACVCFNLILHHLVGADEATTHNLQSRALEVWQGKTPSIFVNEYIYESYFARISGRLIFEITSSKVLSAFGKQVAKVVPALRANTFGVGVRFRSHDEWRDVFAGAGFMVERVRIGHEEPVRLPLRLLLIKSIRRDSYYLRPMKA